MPKTLVDGNGAAAWGARLSRVQVVPNFPITPQTEIIEILAKWRSEGKWKGDFLPLEGEHSVLSAAIASAAAGARTFTGSSSQGLMYMHEMVYVASGMRVPLVMVNVSRGLSAPITLWSDHNDILDQRDSGWLIFFCENNQEVLDTIIQGFRVSEDPRVLLPVFINMDGFILSYTREPVEIPSQGRVDRFLPKYKPRVRIDPERPMALGIGVMKEYTYFRQQVYLANRNALKVIEEVQREWKRKFGRGYSLVEAYEMDDAEACLVVMGANSTIAKRAVRRLREKNQKIGLLRLRVYRPFPEKTLREYLSGVKAVGVIDQNLSPGYGGIVYPEIKSLVPEIPVNSFIMGLGGKYVSVKDFEFAAQKTLKSVKTKKENRFWQEA